MNPAAEPRNTESKKYLEGTIFPADLSLFIVGSNLIEVFNAGQVIINEGTEHCHFFLNLKGKCSIESSFITSTLQLKKNHLIAWGPGDVVKIETPPGNTYLHIEFKMMKDHDVQKPISDWFSFNERENPSLDLNHQKEILDEFIYLPQAKKSGRYHASLATIRLLKIIALLGKDFWVPQHAVHQGPFKELPEVNSTSVDRSHVIADSDEDAHHYVRAINYMCANFRTCTTENLSEHLGLSKPKTISLIKNSAGKLPKELIEDMKMSMSVRVLRSFAVQDLRAGFNRSSTDLVNEIAEHIGYAPRTLNNKFKTIKGRSVHEYYENAKSKNPKNVCDFDP